MKSHCWSRKAQFESLETRQLLANSLPYAESLVAAWDFEEGVGIITADSSGQKHDGMLIGATWSTDAVRGKALQFDGVDDAVDTGSWQVTTNELTLSTWFRADDFGVSDARLISKASGIQEQDHDWMLSTIDNNGLKLRFRLKLNGTTKTLIATRGDLVAGQWMHAAAVYDGSTMRLYLDGVEVGKTNASGAITQSYAKEVWIGNNPVGSRPFDGRIDQVRVFDEALSASQIQTLVNEGPTNNSAPVVDAGPDATVGIDESLQLHGSVTDDGLPYGTSRITTSWSQVSGPSAAHFDSSTAIATSVRFDQFGTYVLRLEASDGELQAGDEVTITVDYPRNTAPTVAAGIDQTVALDETVKLLGKVQDDLLPNSYVMDNAVLAYDLDQSLGLFSTGGYHQDWGNLNEKWIFGDNESAYFILPDGTLYDWSGINNLRRSDEIAKLDPSYYEDPSLLHEAVHPSILIQTLGTLATVWTVSSGPGKVVFADPHAPTTTATFSEAGTYVLSLHADDSEFVQSDDVTITVANSTPTGLVGYWPLEEGSGNTTADHSGGGNTGVVSGAAWSSQGKVGKALSFDGVNDFVDTGNWDVDSNQITIATWLRADDFEVHDARLVSKATGVLEQDHYWMLSTINSGGMKLRFRLKADGVTKTLVADQGILSTGQWLHAAAVYDGTMMRLYLNGVQVGSTTHSGPVSSNASARVALGNNPDGLRPFDGLLDEVRIYDRALSPVELAALIADVPVANLPPTVSAGTDQSITLGTSLPLTGLVSDDGLPSGNLTTSWSQLSGPGVVTFGDASALSTTATFSQAGTYVLSLTANDGELLSSDQLTITVAETTGPQFYLSPTGSDANSGTLPSQAWKTFSHAISQLRPGDTLILADGTYEQAVTGPLLVNAGSGGNAVNGTAALPITIKAQHERGAHLRNNGNSTSVTILNASWYIVEGLRISGQDNSNASSATGISVVDSSHVVVRRNLVHDLNRYAKTSAIRAYRSSDVLVEENEAYNISRNVIYAQSSERVTFRRNYVYAGPRESSISGGPQDAYIAYYSKDVLFENNIAQGSKDAGFGNSGLRNQFLGNVAINSTNGFVVGKHPQEGNVSIDNVYENNVAVNLPGGLHTMINGLLSRSSLNLTVNNLSVFGVSGNGIAADNNYDPRQGPGKCDPYHSICTIQQDPGIHVTNTLVQDSAGGYLVTHADQFSNREFEYSVGWNNGTTWKSGTETRDFATTPPPGVSAGSDLGSRQVFIPAESSLKGAGKNGEDIGANVLYRYQDGVLTNEVLWNAVTGEFPHGAVVPGVNDIPGISAFDVHERLNVTVHLAAALAPSAANLEAAEAAAGTSSTGLTPSQLQPLVDYAIQQFATRAGEGQLPTLQQLEFHIADLDDNLLGKATTNTITLDDNAAGYFNHFQVTAADRLVQELTSLDAQEELDSEVLDQAFSQQLLVNSELLFTPNS